MPDGRGPRPRRGSLPHRRDHHVLEPLDDRPGRASARGLERDPGRIRRADRMAQDKEPMPTSATGVGDRPVRKSILDRHKVLEKNATLLLVASFVVVTVGGAVEIVPLFFSRTRSRKWRAYGPTEI